MRWRIEHSICYHYSRPVALDPHTIRLRPRDGSRQYVLSYELHIAPYPSFRTDHTDSENNELTTVWFQGEHERLECLATSEVEIAARNPYDFIITEPEATRLPLSYPEPDSTLLSAYRVLHEDVSPVLQKILDPVLDRTGWETVPFLSRLVTEIAGDAKREYRRCGGPRSPEETIRRGRGTCRDYTWLYMVACRSLGLAARFVSGYHVPLSRRRKPELHSWAEVFLPGVGWLGFDPSLGLPASDRHIVLATSYDPSRTAPCSGNFWGRDVRSRLETATTIRPVE